MALQQHQAGGGTQRCSASVNALRKLAHGAPTPGVMYGRERPPTPLRTPGLLAPEAVTKISCPPDALRASRGAPVSWCSSVSGGCPSTRVGSGSSSFVRSFAVYAVYAYSSPGPNDPPSVTYASPGKPRTARRRARPQRRQPSATGLPHGTAERRSRLQVELCA